MGIVGILSLLAGIGGLALGAPVELIIALCTIGSILVILQLVLSKLSNESSLPEPARAQRKDYQYGRNR
jgi:hypothetical protein